MRIYIPSKGRAATCATHKLLEAAGCDYALVVHNEDEAAAYRANPTVNPRRLIVSGQPYGLQLQRQWILENLVQPGEWFIFMDDNIHGWTAVPPAYYDRPQLPVQEDQSVNWRQVYDTPAYVPYVLAICEDTRQRAERVGAHYAGFASVDNHYFRGKKFRYVGYVIGKMTLVCRDRAAFDPNVSMEDFAFVAENLRLYGRVVINNFLLPTAGHYEAGGLGRWTERLKQRRADCIYLMAKYPGLFRYKPSHGVADADLALRFHSIDQVERWRANACRPLGEVFAS